MKLYKKGGVVEDLGSLIEALGIASEGMATFKETLDKTDKTAMKALDTVLDKLVSSTSGNLDTAKKAAKKGTKKALDVVMDVIFEQLSKKVGGIFSVDDILAMLSDEEDIVAIKAVTLKADAVKSRGRTADSPGPTVYATTVEAMNDAVYNYTYAPRAKDSTFLALYTAYPEGVLGYISRELEKVNELIMDPVFKGVGLDSISEGGFADMLKGVGGHYKDEVKEVFWEDKGVNLGSPELKRSGSIVPVFSPKNPEDNYKWRIECPVAPNPMVPLAEEITLAVRVTVLGDTGSNIKFRSNGETITFAEGVVPPASNNPKERAVYMTSLGKSGINKANVRMELTELFEFGKPSEFFKVLEENPDIEVFVEYWDYDTSTEELVRLRDFRAVSMSTDVGTDAGNYWVGVSLDGLGSYIPGLDQAVDVAKKTLKELIDTLFKLEDVIQSALTDLLDAIMAIIKRVVDVVYKIMQIFLKLLRVTAAMDIRYANFKGGYTDLPLIWRMIRSDYKLVEAMGNRVNVLLINCKGDFVKKVADSVSKVQEDANKIILANPRVQVPILSSPELEYFEPSSDLEKVTVPTLPSSPQGLDPTQGSDSRASGDSQFIVFEDRKIPKGKDKSGFTMVPLKRYDDLD